MQQTTTVFLLRDVGITSNELKYLNKSARKGSLTIQDRQSNAQDGKLENSSFYLRVSAENAKHP